MSNSINCAVMILLALLCSPSSSQSTDDDPKVSCDPSDDIYHCFCHILKGNVSADAGLFNGLVTCNANDQDSEGSITIHPLNCVTYNGNSTTQFFAGRCVFIGYRSTKKQTLENVTVANLTEQVCAGGTRHGNLCGECSAQYSISLNTLDLRCVESRECKSYYWAVYLVVVFTGITIFYLLIVFLNVRLTSECANGPLILAQIFALPINIITFQRDWAAVLPDRTKIGNGLSNLIQVIYGIWNLDVPTGFISRICVPNTTSLDVFAVQYLTSFFPLILIVISFLLIKLYECNFRLLVFISRPCRHFWLRFRNRIDTRATIIDAFASFLILSYTKFIHISFILLAPTNVYDYKGNVRYTALLYDGSVDYSSNRHTPYTILASIVLVLLVMPPPLLLMFYQFKWFQVVLTKCRINSHLLTLFVYSFQRGYKDGSDQSRDMRYFSTIQFLFRIAVFALYSTVGDYFVLYYCLLALAVIYTFIFAVFRPFKCDYFNKAESAFGLIMTFITATAVQNNIRLIYTQASLSYVSILYVLILFPFLYMCVYFIVWLLMKLYRDNKAKILQQLDDGEVYQSQDLEESHLINPPINGGRVRRVIHSLLSSITTPDTERVPDRLRNPESYVNNSGMYEWCPEEQYTDTATGTDTTTNTTTGTTNSTQPRSTCSEQTTERNSFSINEVRRQRPKSLLSVQLNNLSQQLIPSQHNTN